MKDWRLWVALSALYGVLLCAGVYFGLQAFRSRSADDVPDRQRGDLTIDEAVMQEKLDTRVIVTGYVFIDEHTGVLLCSQRKTANSRPACAGEAVTLQGLDTSRLAVERAEQKERGFDAWVDDPVRLQVRARGATFLVEDILPSG